PRPRCIGFTRTCARSAGLWKESTIEVRRTPFRLCIQFSRRCFAPGRLGFSCERDGAICDCVGGSRRRLRCSTVPHGSKKRGHSSTRWRGDLGRGFWKRGWFAYMDAQLILLKAGAVDRARREPNWIPESLSPHNALQIARERKRNGNSNA